ncbi:MAG: protein GumC [Desulfobacteraceae bacterium]|nr:MAG: protein GumC [Desulfobacteraceae bacterium]
MANFTQQTQIKLDQVVEILFRSKWLIILLFCCFLTLGLAKTLISPRIYQAATLILVQPQAVPANYVRSVISSGIEARISSITQQIMSRSNLEKIINQFGLYKTKEDMYLEDKIADLRERIEINMTRSSRRHGAETFAIQFEGTNPERVMQITNTLASYFMDENLKTREAQVIGTSQFLDEELEKIKKTLETKERQLATYRAEHVGGLPSELESNLRTLDRLQTQLTNTQNSLREAQNTKGTIQQQIIRQKEIVEQRNREIISGTTAETGNTGLSSDELALAKSKEELRTLLLKYTERHPDVIKAKSKIGKLEVKAEEARKKRLEQEGESQEEAQVGSLNADPEIMELEIQLKQIENSIAAYLADIGSLKNKMREHEQRVAQTPEREQELQKLLRDYASIQNVYTSLLDRRLEAELSVNMEKKQKGEQFRVLDYAVKPAKPISPNVRADFVKYFGICCIITGGIIYLIFVFDNSVRRKEDIEELYGLPVLIQIGNIRESKGRITKKLGNLVFVVASSYVFLIVGVFGALELYGIERAVNLIKSYFNL